MATLPPIVLDVLSTPKARIHVVRDDLLEGGTKQRAAVPFLMECRERGGRNFVYASPFAGFAQVALAVTCQELDLACTLNCQVDPATGEAHEFTRLARVYGAKITLFKSLAQAETEAERYAAADNARLKLPLGFDCPGYRLHLRVELWRQWQRLLRLLPRAPDRLWLPLGSGTLATVFREVVPESTRLSCVDVHVLPADDARVVRVRGLARSELYSAPEAFSTPVEYAPPIASNRFYDAKVWRLVSQYAGDGDVWWNVAR